MNKIITASVIALFLIGCGGDDKKSIETVLTSTDLKEVRAFRTEIDKEQKKYAEQLKQLDNRISELDTDKKIELISSKKVKEEVFNHYLEFQGNVTTKNLLVVYPEYAGLLKQVFVKEGDKVTKGQILAKIDDGGLSQQLSQLEIQRDLAKTTFERQERLWKEKIGSEIQFLQAKTAYEGQQKAVNQLQEQIAKTNVKAPFTGVVDEVIIEQGALVSPGANPLFRVINLNSMYIETNVPEGYIASVTTNKNVEVSFPVTGQTIQAKVGAVGNYINPANRTFKIEIPLINEDQTLKPNLTARLRINDYTNDTALLIPQSIISENANGEQYIYVVRNKKGAYATAEQVIITTGQSQGDIVEVLKGITSGDEIVIEGARSISNGQAIKIDKN